MTTRYNLRVFLMALFGFLGVFALVGCTPTSTNDPIQEPTPTAETCQFLPPAEPNYTPTYDYYVSITELIDSAWRAGEISDGERLVYTAYGLYESSSLPARFIGTRLVEGTSSAIELAIAVQDPNIMCQLNLCEQEELKRLLKTGVDCNEIP